MAGYGANDTSGIQNVLNRLRSTNTAKGPDPYMYAPSSQAVSNSNISRQEIMDTLSPEAVAGNTNVLTDLINKTFNQRREEVRRKYMDFPEMASAEEGALERDRANALSKAELDSRSQANAQSRQALMQQQQFESSQARGDRDFMENKRRYDEGRAAQANSEMNQFFQQAYARNAAKKIEDQWRQAEAGGGYRGMGGSTAPSPSLSNRPYMGGYDTGYTGFNAGNLKEMTPIPKTNFKPIPKASLIPKSLIPKSRR